MGASWPYFTDFNNEFAPIGLEKLLHILGFRYFMQ